MGGLGVLAALVIAAVVLIVVTGGDDDDCCAPPPDEAVTEVPPSAVAVVEEAPEQYVEIDDFDPALIRAAAFQGTKGVPEPGDPQYELVRDQAMTELLNAAWVAGEAEERGIAVTDAEVAAEIDRTVDDSFSDRRQFEDFVADQAYCTEDELATVEPERCEGLRAQVRTTLLADAITAEVLGTAAPDTTDPDQAEATEAFQNEFTEKWTARTTCADAYVTERCSNGTEAAGSGPATAPTPAPGAPPVSP